jgi:3-isopropylmalate/(R)-2-methylmalate dehydratase small subunit
MDHIIRHKGKCVPLLLPNIDTDQIVPKKFLLKVDRTGYDIALFHDWRFETDGEPNKEFVLNDPKYDGATVLIAGPNFGCGSSREHAPWALREYGFRVIIAESFADIFYNNCVKTGLLPITLPSAAVSRLASDAKKPEGLTLEIDLAEQRVSDGSDTQFSFEIDEFRRSALLKGLDDIEQTLGRAGAIADFESKRRSFLSP